MADNGNGGSSVGIVAIVVIFIIVVLVALYFLGVFGGRKTEIQINTPSAPAAPSK